MSEFLAAMWPVLLLWTIPVFPMIYAGLAGTVEWLARSVRRPGPGTARPVVSAALAPTD